MQANFREAAGEEPRRSPKVRVDQEHHLTKHKARGGRMLPVPHGLWPGDWWRSGDSVADGGTPSVTALV